MKLMESNFLIKRLATQFDFQTTVGNSHFCIFCHKYELLSAPVPRGVAKQAQPHNICCDFSSMSSRQHILFMNSKINRI